MIEPYKEVSHTYDCGHKLGWRVKTEDMPTFIHPARCSRCWTIEARMKYHAWSARCIEKDCEWEAGGTGSSAHVESAKHVETFGPGHYVAVMETAGSSVRYVRKIEKEKADAPGKA